MERYRSQISQFLHFLSYSAKKPTRRVGNAMFIISIDVDVGSKQLGVVNRGKNDANVNDKLSEHQIGDIEERAFPLFAEVFNDLEVPVTFAIRGQLTQLKNTILELLPRFSIKHDIGAHGFYHRTFTDLTRAEADNELHMISSGMKNFNIVPKSFVFPKNRVAHLDLLAKYGYKCYRGSSGFANDCMYIEKEDRLFDVHPSLYLDRVTTCSMFPRKILDIAIARKLPFHAWFHFWNFGETDELIKKSINNLILPLLKHAKEKEKSGALMFETMLSAVEKTEKCEV